MARSAVVLAFLLIACSAQVVDAQSLYKYRGENGEWIFTDRKPAADRNAEVRDLQSSYKKPHFELTHRVVGQTVEFVAANTYYAPIEVSLEFHDIVGFSYPHPDDPLRWTVPARATAIVLTLNLLGEPEGPRVDYGYRYLAGDPTARHAPGTGYQVPFSVGAKFPVTQAYPETLTHKSRDSMYAIDIAMPIGTDILASRDGIVFDVASKNFRGGLDAATNGDEANIVRILHEDGTFSLYAHLNWNSIRVKPGDQVHAGQYIADSGNTGYSSGPHLHFAIQRNTGMRIDSIPVAFRGANAAHIVPKSGESLAGYR